MARITMKDVARRAGVSTSTVSRALNSHPRIPAQTRKRIQKIARELGFRPDPGAANLVAHRWNRDLHAGELTVALVHRAASVEADRDNPLFEKYAARVGFRLDPFAISSPQELKNLPRVLRSRGISGVILEFVIEQEEVEACRQLASQFPLVIANHRQGYDVAPSVVRDAYHRVSDSLAQVLAHGYRRVMLALPGPTAGGVNEMLGQMQAAYLLQKQQAPEGCELQLCLYHGPDGKGVEEQVPRFQPDAVVGFEGIVPGALKRMNLHIPRDVAYAGMAVEGEGIAGISDSRPLVLGDAVELLRMMIRSGQTGNSLAGLRHEARGHWQDGATLPRLVSNMQAKSL